MTHLNEKKIKFWTYLDEDVFMAKQEGAGFILQFDGNLWCGPELLPGDLRSQNRNGKLFEDFLSRNKLTLVNALDICDGLITRERILKNGTIELSALDFFIACETLVKRMVKRL